VRERFEGQPLAGVLLLTDGNATDLPSDGTLDLAGLPPIYPVVVGDGGVRDLRIERATVRQTEFDDAPVSVQVDLSGHGFAGQQVEVTARVLASEASGLGAESPETQQARVRRDDESTPVTFRWQPGGSGVQFYEINAEPTGAEDIDEATLLNNRRVVMVDRGRPAFRILYVSGRPSWDFKFLHRALFEDPQLQMVGLLRVARREPKFEFKGRAGEASNPMFRGFGGDAEEAPRYDQPVLVRLNTRDETELVTGFPVSANELFAYDAIVLDDVEAEFFTHEQLALIRRFSAERGGGLLMLGGADSLESGHYEESPLASALPVYLDRVPVAAPQGRLTWNLSREGWLEPWVRVRETESDERVRLTEMPPLLVANGLAAVKPGATVLATILDETGEEFPALVSQRFGAGRVACMTVGDMWRWGLHGAKEQADLARFWRQLARWLVTDVPAQVALRVEKPSGESGNVRLRVTARDRDYRHVDLATARLQVRRLDAEAAQANDAGDSGFSAVTLTPEPVADKPGEFSAEFPGRDAGTYLAEVEVTALNGEVLGRAQAGWVVDPAAEEFRSLEPNRTLVGEIARRTGGEVLTWAALPGFVADLPSRDAPITEAWSFPLWDTAWVFLIVLGCFIAEWAWRRMRGLP